MANGGRMPNLAAADISRRATVTALFKAAATAFDTEACSTKIAKSVREAVARTHGRVIGARRTLVLAQLLSSKEQEAFTNQPPAMSPHARLALNRAANPVREVECETELTACITRRASAPVSLAAPFLQGQNNKLNPWCCPPRPAPLGLLLLHEHFLRAAPLAP